MAVPLGDSVAFEVASDDLVPILLVDDQPANLLALELTLGSSGCRFVQARSADEALMALLDQDFAAIVLDIMMPGMSGLELAALIKQRKRTQHVPILFLTAHMLDQHDILQGYEAGAVDYLTKPISPDILRSKIAVFADLYRKTHALGLINDALQREVAERQRMEEALRLANQDLEARVEERTTALREADRRKDEFLAALAHELRNPLAALRTAVEVFRLKAPPSKELEIPQGVMSRQLQQMTRLIDDLLDVSRITRDQLMLRPEKVDLTVIIAAAVETVRPIIEQRGHTLSVDLPTEPVVLEADVVRLSQVFSNLLDNAAKYTEPGGVMKVVARASNSEVIVSVQDSGAGIRAEMLPRIFDLFVQAHDTPGLGHGGLGIGLTLVRRLVEMHGGSVSAKSDGPSRGSEFYVRLPIIGRANYHHMNSAERKPSGLKQALRVLIVEDNRDAAAVLSMMLTEWGHETRMAHDAKAALDAAEKFAPNVILLDIGLPQMHGYEVARRIKDEPWGKKITLIAVTGWGQEADRMQSKAAGIDHHLLKPADPDTLKGLLDGLAKN